MTDLLGGQVTIMMDGVASALPHVSSGKLKALAVTTAQRTPQLPDVPTISESGFPGFLGVGWAGLFMPVGGAKELVEKISADVRAVLNEPDMKKRIVDRGAIPDPMTPQQTAEFVRADTARWGEVAKTANIKID
jgi:tripartite-type tricarboxylate transporter receptor subunit TctC